MRGADVLERHPAAGDVSQNRAELKGILQLSPAFLLFIAGAGSQYMTDVVLAASADPEDLLLWTQLKPLVLLGGALGVVGLEQVIIREPHAPYPVVRLAIAVALGASIVIALVTAQFASPRLGLGAAVGVFMFALSTLVFSVARSSGRFVVAHLGRDGWKVVLLGLCVGSILLGRSPDLVLSLALAFCVGTLPFLGGLRHRPAGAAQHSRDVHSAPTALRAGMPFCLSAVSLALGSYGELLVLNAFAQDDVVRTYFVAALAFAYPALMFNTFLAGLLSVRVRNHPELFKKMSGVSAATLGAAIAALAFVLFTCGAIAVHVLGVMTLELATIGALLAISGAVRLAAVLSTSGLGVLAPRSMLDTLSTLYFVGSLLMVAVMAALVAIGAAPATTAAASVAVYWTARLVIAQIFSRRVSGRLQVDPE